MKKSTRTKRVFFLLLTFVSGIVIFTFFQLLRADISPLTATIDGLIGTGKQQLFSRTVTGLLDAHQTFLSAKGLIDTISVPTDEQKQQKIKIHAYVALTRLADATIRNDGAGAETVRKILAQYGITFTGNNFADIKAQLPTNSQDKPILPAAAPSGEALRAFLAGPFLTAINASLADMDTTIGLLGTTESKEIIAKALLDDPQSPDPTLQDVELDDGDYYLFRASLKTMKGCILTWAAYNQDFDVRELVALINSQMGNIQNFLDRHPALLNVRDGGPAALAEAKQTFISAIDDYLTASDKTRNDNDLTAGATECFMVDEEDTYGEGLFRENLAKVKTSLQQNAPVQFINDRIGTEYYVYGGASFSTTEPSWWDKGLHPEEYGYAYLGKASATATFNGTYAYYVIMAKPGNRAPVDAVQGSTGTYLSTGITGNTSDWWNIGGAPNGSYALIGNGHGRGFVVINPAAAITSLTVNLASAPGVAPREEYGDRINYYPIFGNGTAALNLRDLLPQFSPLGVGQPIAGTVGHGLGNDPTLGGIAPDQTQTLWQRGDKLQPTGVLTIPTAPITVDGTVSDWNGVPPVLEDVMGETDPSRDLTRLYLAKDGNYLYFRIDLAGNYAPYNEYQIQFRKLPGDAPDVVGDVRYSFITYQTGLATWQLFKKTYQTNGTWSSSADIGLNNVSGNGAYIEGRIPLTTVGELGGRFIGVRMSPWHDDWNNTSIQVTPAASLTGMLTIPNYSGAGPIYIEAYRYAGGIGIDPDNSSRLGGQVIFPGQYSPGMTYSVNGLPVGERIFLFVHWDKDMNGIVTPGDYTDFSLPLTTVAGNNSKNLAVPDNHPSFPLPEFREAEVFSTRDQNNVVSIFMRAYVVGPSPEDVTVTVHGPGGDYTLAPSMYVQQKGITYNIPSAARPHSVPDGDYIFEAVDSLGRRVTSAPYHYVSNGSLPLVSTVTGTFSPANRAFVGTTTPTFSWQAPAGGPYYYKVRVQDWFGNDAWCESDIQTATSFTVPQGVLQPDTPYLWSVRLYDSAGHPMNRTVTKNLSFHTGTGGQPAISSVNLTTRTPTGSQRYSTTLFTWVTNVFPEDVKYIALTGPTPATTTLASYTYNASVAPPLSYRFTNSAPYSLGYSPNPSAFPATGTYTIQVKYQRTGETAQTTLSMDVPYEHKGPVTPVDLSSLSLPDNYYFNTATPRFSWSPAGDPTTYYYRLSISDTLDKCSVWNSAWTKGTSVVVPPGVLVPGVSYYWSLRSSLDYDSSRNSTIGKYSSYIDAHTDGTKFRFTVNRSQVDFPGPVFKEVSVASRSTATGFNVNVNAYLSGPSPDDVTITVSGPGGVFTLLPDKYDRQKGLRYHYETANNVNLPAGDYTFEAVDPQGRRAQPVTYHYEYNGALPFVDTATVLPADRAFLGTSTPQLSWSAPAGGSFSYRIMITDWSGSDIWYQSDIQAETSLTVPAGLLQPNTPYRWVVRVYDGAGHPMNYTETPALYFHTGPAQPPALSQVNVSTRPPGAGGTYTTLIQVFQLSGVLPEEVTTIRLKDQSGSVVASGTPSLIYRFHSDAYYEISYAAATPPVTGNYTIEVDYQRTGIDMNLITVATAPFAYQYHPVLAVDITSLNPMDNYYFASTTPAFSWNPVGDPNTYYRLQIKDPLDYTTIWQSSWSKNTTAAVPAGILIPGVTYAWRVQTSSDFDPLLGQETGRYDSYANMLADGKAAYFRFTVSGSPALKGDLNDDGRVDLLDAVLALQILAGMNPGMLRPDYSISGVDPGGNGKVGTEDLIYILQRVSGLR